MKTTLGQLCDHLESIAPLALQENYDNAGLLYGDRDVEITGVLCSLDATSELVIEAAERGCNVLVAHHPIIFSGVKKLSRDHYVGRAIIEAIRRNVAIYAIHTNLDNILDKGVNQAIAARLGLQQVQILSPRSIDEKAGAGLTGMLPEAMHEKDFLPFVKTQMKTACVRHTALTGKEIRKVALCGGAGSFLIHQAIQSGADAYITADVKYHEFFEADGRILLLDIGHFESEQFTIPLLAEIISEKFPNFAAYCTELNTNPVHYF